MNKLYSIAVLCLLYSTSLLAQNNADSRYYHRNHFVDNQKPTGDESSSNFTGQSGTGANMDVVYHRANWRLNPDSAKAIKGEVTTYFKTIAANVNIITFDLRQSSFNNANLIVTYHGITCTRTLNASNVLSITLPSTISAINTLDSVSISYYGIPPAPSGSAQGFQIGLTPSAQNYINTLSESYEDRDWWPCKADMQDKIDSMDIIVNTRWSGADTFWVATNGKLVDSTISAGRRIFTFKTRYPMASYLVSLGIARYNRYYRGTVNVGGDQVPIVYNLFRGKTAAQYNAILTSMDYMTTLLVEFSNRFGLYPFRKEKHGFYEGLQGAGGMEHQTFSAMATSTLNSRQTLTHELIHQWFGNKVTFSTWADLWLAEGFARYGEVMAGELLPATGVNPLTELTAARNAARSNTTTPTRITSFANSNQVWSSTNASATYDRGCMVISMLRTLAGDNLFYESCRSYLNETNGAGFKSANTDSLKNNFNKVLGTDLTPFFNDYVLGTGHPTYTIHWQPKAGGGIFVSVGGQTRTAGSTVSYFNSPIVLRVQGAGGMDTTIVFYDLTDGDFINGELAKAGGGIGTALGGNRLLFPLSFTPTIVTFDPGFKTIAGGSALQVSTLDLQIIDFDITPTASGNNAILILDDNTNNAAIVLQRSSNGANFSDLGIMSFIQDNNAGKKYSFKDLQPLKGSNFYRAVFKSAEGTANYSRIVKINGNSPSLFSIVKNPIINGRIELFSPVDAGNSVQTFVVYDASGKVVQRESRTISNQNISINIGRLSKGSYILSIGNEMQHSIKFIVQ